MRWIAALSAATTTMEVSKWRIAALSADGLICLIE